MNSLSFSTDPHVKSTSSDKSVLWPLRNQMAVTLSMLSLAGLCIGCRKEVPESTALPEVPEVKLPPKKTFLQVSPIERAAITEALGSPDPALREQAFTQYVRIDFSGETFLSQLNEVQKKVDELAAYRALPSISGNTETKVAKVRDEFWAATVYGANVVVATEQGREEDLIRFCLPRQESLVKPLVESVSMLGWIRGGERYLGTLARIFNAFDGTNVIKSLVDQYEWENLSIENKSARVLGAPLYATHFEEYKLVPLSTAQVSPTLDRISGFSSFCDSLLRLLDPVRFEKDYFVHLFSSHPSITIACSYQLEKLSSWTNTIPDRPTSPYYDETLNFAQECKSSHVKEFASRLNDLGLSSLQSMTLLEYLIRPSTISDQTTSVGLSSLAEDWRRERQRRAIFSNPLAIAIIDNLEKSDPEVLRSFYLTKTTPPTDYTRNRFVDGVNTWAYRDLRQVDSNTAKWELVRSSVYLRYLAAVGKIEVPTITIPEGKVSEARYFQRPLPKISLGREDFSRLDEIVKSNNGLFSGINAEMVTKAKLEALRRGLEETAKGAPNSDPFTFARHIYAGNIPATSANLKILVESLGSKSFYISSMVEDALVHRGQEVLPKVEELLGSSERLVREAASRVVLRTSNPETTQTLNRFWIQWLEDLDRRGIGNLVTVLNSLPNSHPKAIAIFAEEILRYEATKYHGFGFDDEYLDALGKLASKGDLERIIPEISRRAADKRREFYSCNDVIELTYYARAGVVSAIDGLIGSLSNDNRSWGNPAAKAFESLRSLGPVAIPALEKAISSEDASTRKYAMFALHDIKEFTASKKLSFLLNDPDDVVRTNAIRILPDIEAREMAAYKPEK